MMFFHKHSPLNKNIQNLNIINKAVKKTQRKKMIKKSDFLCYQSIFVHKFVRFNEINFIAMRAYLVFCIGLMATAIMSCSPAHSGEKKAGKMIFAETEHDFGTIAEGSVAEFAFVFRNVGNEPLVISNVQTSCGCTVPAWSQEPVKKHEQGVVKIHYNTRILGSFKKTIVVHSNAANSPVTLTIKGTVVPTAKEN